MFEMKKPRKIISTLAATIFLIFPSGCGITQSTSAQANPVQVHELKNVQYKTLKLTLPQSFDKQYYTPLKPELKDPLLETNYTPEQLKDMPFTEAHGQSQIRSVPLGQTLEANKQDTTKGPLQKYRIVSFYGNPHSKQMGILGNYSPDELMTKLKEQTQAYSNIDPKRPAIPAIELITTIAQRNPGPNGLYYHETSTKDIEEYAKLAKDNNALLVLDVQLGEDNIMHQVKLLKDYLKLPYVYLAIDTEFHVKPGQTPGVNLGHVNGANVQEAIDYVSNLVKENHLPDKVVVVHQFADQIINNKQAIHPTDHVEVVLNNDGFGGASIKRAEYHLLVHNEPIQYGGFKIFYKQDDPVMSPKDVLEMDPAPAFVDYQ